jgi:hypothetical protein
VASPAPVVRTSTLVDRKRAQWPLALALLGACAEFGGGSGDEVDGGVLGPAIDASLFDAEPGALGTQGNPADSCAQLLVEIGDASGVYWVRRPGGGPILQVYCEQELNQGGWALLYNSVYTANGLTTAFWQFGYADRFDVIGTPAPDQNYYHGDLYRVGVNYMDVFTDLAGESAIVAVVATAGIDEETMRFVEPTLTIGNQAVFNAHFAAGWSALDHDGDSHDPEAGDGNCATLYSNVAQHYSACWNYNLGSDAEEPHLDGGVGPHVHNSILMDRLIGLSPQVDGGNYSRVNRIARFTRW